MERRNEGKLNFININNMTYSKTKIYETPLVAVTTVSTENGFAQSGVVDSASSNYVTENPLGEI